MIQRKKSKEKEINKNNNKFEEKIIYINRLFQNKKFFLYYKILSF
jgi:hypothetical protein